MDADGENLQATGVTGGIESSNSENPFPTKLKCQILSRPLLDGIDGVNTSVCALPCAWTRIVAE